MANLALEASNNQKNFNANQIYKETGASPNQATDKRTTTDKYAGTEGMKQLVRDTLSGADFMNQIEAADCVKLFNGDDVDFFLKYKSFILTDFKGRGIPAKVFYDYLQRLKEKQNTNAGVEFGLADSANQALLESVATHLGNSEKERLIGQAMDEFNAGRNPNPFVKRLHKLLIKSQADWERDSLSIDELGLLQRAEAAGNLNVVDVNRSLAVAGLARPTEQILAMTGHLLALKEAGEPAGGMNQRQVEKYLETGRDLLDIMTISPDDKQLLKQAKRQVAQIKSQMDEEEKLANQIAREAERVEAEALPAREQIRLAQELGVARAPELRREEAEALGRRLAGVKATKEEQRAKSRAAVKLSLEAKAAAEAEVAERDPFARAFPGLEEGAFEEAPPARGPVRGAEREGGAMFAALPPAQQTVIRKQIRDHATGATLAEKINNISNWCARQARTGQPGWDAIGDPEIQAAATATGDAGDMSFKEFKALLAFVEQEKLRAAGPPVGRGMRGTGLGRKRSAVDRSEGYKKPPSYKQLGRYLVNHHKLGEGILMIKSPSGAAVKQIPTQSVSSHYADALHYIAGGHAPPLDLFERFSKDEKAHLHNVIKHSRVEGTGVPNPQKEDEDKDINRFHILKGEIIAGNDSTPLAREFKGLLIKLMRQGRIPRREGNEILEELLHLGH